MPPCNLPSPPSHATKPLQWLKTSESSITTSTTQRPQQQQQQRFLLQYQPPQYPLPSPGLSLCLTWAFLSHFPLLGGDGDIAALWLRREAAAAACQREFPPRQLLLPSGNGNACSFCFGVVGFRRFSGSIGFSFGDLGCVLGVVGWVVWGPPQLNFIVGAGFWILGFGLLSFARAAFAHLCVWFGVVCLGAPVSVSVSAEFRFRLFFPGFWSFLWLVFRLFWWTGAVVHWRGNWLGWHSLRPFW